MISKEGGHSCGFRGMVVHHKLCPVELGLPIILEVVDIGLEILFEDCIEALCLPVGFRMEGDG